MELSHEDCERLYQKLDQTPYVKGSVILKTCNRFEVYATTNQDLSHEIIEFVAESTGTDPALIGPSFYRQTDSAVIAHLFRVSSGLNSQLLGETEILGQVKSAYRDASKRGSVEKTLHRIFQKALQTGKWARTATAIGQGQVSLGNVTVDLAERIYGPLKGVSTLVIGSGEIGRDVAKALTSRGVDSLTVTSRNLEKAQKLAFEIQAETVPFDHWKEKLPDVDIAIFATSAPLPILQTSDIQNILAKRQFAPLFLVDLAMPRNIEHQVGELESVFLYNLEELSKIANENRALRQAEVERCEIELRQRATYHWERL